MNLLDSDNEEDDVDKYSFYEKDNLKTSEIYMKIMFFNCIFLNRSTL